MGYSKEGSITNYWPDDGSDDFWITSASQPSIADIIEMAHSRWGAIDLNDIIIESENIHTHNVACAFDDSGDYTDFIHVCRAAK